MAITRALDIHIRVFERVRQSAPVRLKCISRFGVEDLERPPCLLLYVGGAHYDLIDDVVVLP